MRPGTLPPWLPGRFSRKAPHVPDWLKVLVLIIGLGGWLATVVVSLLRGELPDPATLGIPAILVAAVAPPVRIGRGGATRTRRVAPAPNDGTDNES